MQKCSILVDYMTTQVIIDLHLQQQENIIVLQMLILQQVDKALAHGC